MKVSHCDICDTDKEVSTIRFEIERIPDGAGTSTTLSEYADLCPGCFNSILRTYFKKELSQYTVNRGLMELVKERYSSRAEEHLS